MNACGVECTRKRNDSSGTTDRPTYRGTLHSGLGKGRDRKSADSVSESLKNLYKNRFLSVIRLPINTHFPQMPYIS